MLKEALNNWLPGREDSSLLCFLHFRASVLPCVHIHLALSSPGHVGHAHFKDDKELLHDHQRAFTVARVALSEVAHSEASLGLYIAGPL